MLKQVLHGLQTLQSLSEYPLRTQKKLCRVAWYQRVDSKKAIIREGHHPECFYFILSGICFVKRLTEDPLTGDIQNVCMARLSKGQSFGELGLVFNTVRTATVESVTPMELLVIRREDFLTIFMNADNPDEEADHIRFLRQIPLFKSFPIDALKKEPGMCLLNYFKRGNVIVENSQCSDWLYIIKTGSCEVIQRLHAVQPRLPRRRFSAKHKLPNLDIGETRSRLNSVTSSKTSKKTMNSEVVLLSHNEV
ncbi:cyclic nucleotide-binding domain-containing protein 2-like [Gigantopelta aegis]|uniref:cyclic nucleotide-binding domain-containing protein 2-like n=1 Tax=Gigantopelta aegis TaxID=1735272 RepID=UPI001B88C510|nr:cyclic nucleotide-binding domain-containing protein 2-like [Gigantopelta aegis]